jgi:predicted glycoside hydrolase/deacetylase ChbG (UPF0249 family)
MLIVNADDLGASRASTDAIIAAYDEGLITSASAMVWMWDGPRAARLARERQIPVGMHLNLTLPFRDLAAPANVRDLQGELTLEFDARSGSSDAKPPLIPDDRIATAIADQLAAFRALFGEPTHLDGHHHVHLHPSVLACLPPELPIRPPLRRPAHLATAPTRRDRLLRMMFQTIDGCVDIQHIHPALGGADLRWLDYSRRHTLEVMVHPQAESEQRALRTHEWKEALSALTLGSYADVRFDDDGVGDPRPQ